MSTYPKEWDASNSESSLRYPYLRFDAFSFKDLLNSYLSQNTEFTDHIYPGSNLSILIDCLSELFSSLAYNLNCAASESMLSDTLIYKNLNRLVKFLGYCPAGYSASTVVVNARAKRRDDSSMSFVIVPKYSTITLNETDSTGRAVSFSTTDYFYINSGNSNEITLTNGCWKYYNTRFTSSGEPYEKFILDSINIEGTENEYVAFPYIDVYIKRPLGAGEYETIYYKPTTEGLYVNSENDVISTPKERKFAVRLNEYGRYEIEFGDGIHGAKLNAGDVIHVVFLRSNGPDGEISSGEIDNQRFTVGIDGLNYSSTDKSALTMSDIMELSNVFDNSILTFSEQIGAYNADDERLDSTKEFFYGCTNASQSSTPKKGETVDQIRSNAPNWFKRMGRTITIDDYTAYIKSNFFTDIVDVVVMNNYQYMAKFYKWLWFLGKEKLDNPRKWINPSLTSLGNYGYKYSDAADSNNVYIWIKQETSSTSVGKRIIKSLQDIKPLTAEPVVISAVDVNFTLCAGCPSDSAEYGKVTAERSYYNNNYGTEGLPFVYNDRGQNRLEVEISSGLNVSSSIIKNRVLSVFKNFFSSSCMNIGGTVRISELEATILGIDGVKSVRTIFRKKLEDGTYSNSDVIIRNGISLAHWNDSIVDGYDFDITNANVTLEPFQYPQYHNIDGLTDRIDVIVNGTSNLSQSDYGY